MSGTDDSTDRGEAGPGGRPLEALVSALYRPELGSGMSRPRRISGITTRSDEVAPGSLFIAIRGTSADGHAFVDEAVRAGAAAVVVERDFAGDSDVPTIRVSDTRRAAAELAAAWYGNPARRLRLVGITGSLGKTSMLAMLEAILGAAGAKAGTLGSLGVHVDGTTRRDTATTAPGPLLLHRELARIVGEGCNLAAMEVTSHALVQERVHGLRFDLGVFTNLVPLEHSEYHDTFRDYVDAKRRFFRHLRPRAPLVYNIDSRIVRRVVHGAGARPIGCGTGRAAVVRIEPGRMDLDGSRFRLHVRRPLLDVEGREVPRDVLALEIRIPGYSNMTNAALAATAGLCLQAEPEAIRAGLMDLPPQPRRLEVVQREPFLVVDDTVGHPDSISALFQVVERIGAPRVHIAFAVRGQRGPRVNRQTAEALAIWSRQVPMGRLVVTRSEESADALNEVEPAELEAVESALRARGVDYAVRARLDGAVTEALEAAGQGELVLLLGAQGMDQGQEVARRWLEAHEAGSAR